MAAEGADRISAGDRPVTDSRGTPVARAAAGLMSSQKMLPSMATRLSTMQSLEYSKRSRKRRSEWYSASSTRWRSAASSASEAMSARAPASISSSGVQSRGAPTCSAHSAPTSSPRSRTAMSKRELTWGRAWAHSRVRTSVAASRTGTRRWRSRAPTQAATSSARRSPPALCSAAVAS